MKSKAALKSIKFMYKATKVNQNLYNYVLFNTMNITGLYMKAYHKVNNRKNCTVHRLGRDTHK